MKIQRFTAGAAPNNIAQALLRSGLSIPELRALSPLEENAQRLVDQAVVEVGLERLVVAQDILSRGLTFPLTDPLSVMEVQWERISKTGYAQRTMAPQARGEYQLPDRSIKRCPVYLTTDDFSVNIRTLKASERIGTPIDTTLVKQATRRVNEAIEDAAINGAGVQVGGGDTVPSTCFGLRNAPNANTQALSTDWTAAAPVLGTYGPAVLADVLSMAGKLQGDKKYGPYNLYVGTTAGNNFNNDFKTNGDLTVRQRLEELEFGGEKLTVRIADQFPGASTGDQSALVQMTDDVVDMIDGQAPTVIPWTSADGFVLFWMVMAIMVPRIRDDYDGNSGVCLGQKA